MRLVAISDFSNFDIFQGNNPSWFFVSSVLEVVKTVIIQNKPPSLPAFVSSSWKLFQCQRKVIYNKMNIENSEQKCFLLSSVTNLVSTTSPLCLD